jgi:hypothetical protein
MIEHSKAKDIAAENFMTDRENINILWSLDAPTAKPSKIFMISVKTESDVFCAVMQVWNGTTVSFFDEMY